MRKKVRKKCEHNFKKNKISLFRGFLILAIYIGKMANINTPKNPKEFICEICDFITFNKKDFNRHLLTQKHIKLTYTNKKPQINFEKKQELKNYNCECGNIYKHSSSLSKHKKKCIKDENLNLIVKETSYNQEQLELLIKELVKQNQGTQENQMQMFQQMMEFMKQQSSITTNNIVNNNNNYTQFNLQVYLNETCKNAMNIDQFIEYLQPTLQELEDTARLGYVEGITRIILRGLKDLEETERPFHCSDLKREIMFVKNNNDIWEKEPDEKPQLMKVVKAISRKNFCNVSAWQKEHPTWRNHDSIHNDQYNQILVNSTSGATEKEQIESYEKIMKNIMKNIVIDKSKKNK